MAPRNKKSTAEAVEQVESPAVETDAVETESPAVETDAVEQVETDGETDAVETDADGETDGETGVQPLATGADVPSDAEQAATDAANAAAATFADLDDGPTSAPHADMVETDPPDGADAITVREWLLRNGRAAKTSVFNAAVDYGFRLRQVLAYGQFSTAEAAWLWIAANLGTARSTGSQYVQCYRVAVESPIVASEVSTVDGITFLAQFSHEDRAMIVQVARNVVGGERSLPVTDLSDAAEQVSDAYGERMNKQRERQASREATRAAAKAEAAAKTATEAKAAADAAKTAADGETDADGDDGETDAANADGGAIVTDEAKLARERQAAYDGLVARHPLAFLDGQLHRTDGASPAQILLDVFEQGLILGGATGPQTLLAFRLMFQQAKTTDADPFGIAAAVESPAVETAKLAERVKTATAS